MKDISWLKDFDKRAKASDCMDARAQDILCRELYCSGFSLWDWVLYQQGFYDRLGKENETNAI